MKKSVLSSLIVAGALCFCPLAHSATDADDSAKNQIDKNGETVTPEDQSNAQADIDVTAAIRRAVVKDDSLSTYAHNIKIITTEKHVVYLRGPVASADEVATLVKIAKQNAGKYPVKNQLTVNKK